MSRVIVHVSPANLAANAQQGTNLPVWIVRPENEPTKVVYAQKVILRGEVDSEYTPTNPLPDTAGRGVAYLLAEHADVLLEDGTLVESTTLFAGVTA